MQTWLITRASRGFGRIWATTALARGDRATATARDPLSLRQLPGIAAFPTLGPYDASKWGLEGMSAALAQEVAPLGVHVTIVEPGPYGTDCSGASAVHAWRDLAERA
jgi:NAD(P)-dependent dehydrogenase (short-subunit alcohol dehydrogenase family)